MSGAGGGASMGGVFVVQAERTKRKPARREYKPTSRRQPLMKPPSEIHSRRIANPVTAPQDASHFLPNTWPAWWRVFARPARAIYTGKKSGRFGNLVSVACLTASGAHLMSRAALWHSVVESAKPL